MRVDPDEMLQKLAFQRGVLTLLKDTNLMGAMIEKAIEEIDFLIESLPSASNR